MMNSYPSGRITQGDLIEGLSTFGYEDSRCFGLVITARCDLAHSKTSFINYLPVVPIEEWLTRSGWRSPVQTAVSDLLNTLVNELNKLKVQDSGYIIDLLKTYGPEDALNAVGPSPNPRIVTLIDDIGSCLKCLNDMANMTLRVGSVKVVKEAVQKFLGKVIGRELADVHYLPVQLGGERQIDCVVLFRHVHGFIVENLERLAPVLGPPAVTSKVSHLGRVARVISPHIELIMQRFSLVFCRVGTPDGPSPEPSGIYERIKEKLC